MYKLSWKKDRTNTTREFRRTVFILNCGKIRKVRLYFCRRKILEKTLEPPLSRSLYLGKPPRCLYVERYIKHLYRVSYWGVRNFRNSFDVRNNVILPQKFCERVSWILRTEEGLIWVFSKILNVWVKLFWVDRWNNWIFED